MNKQKSVAGALRHGAEGPVRKLDQSRERKSKSRKETAMKKKYKLDEIDCANCALKLENAIKEVDGVSNVKVNYMMQKMTLEAEDASFDAVEKSVIALCKRMEPDMDVSAV